VITGSWFSVQILYFFLRRGNVFLMQLTVILFVKDFVGGVMVNMFAYVGGRARLPDTILEEDHPMTIPSKFGSN
jgi:hypothetical protein